MRKQIQIIISGFLLVLTSSVFVSCEKVFMNPNASTEPTVVFEEYARLCLGKYALAKEKGIDLRTLVDSIRPLVNDDMSEKELFDLLGIITVRMREGHTYIENMKDDWYYGWYYFVGYPSANNFLIASKYYYGEEANPNVQIISDPESFFDIKYGFFPQDSEIAYIKIQSFQMSPSDEQLDKMMSNIKNAKGIVIDVRSNFGGYIDFAARLASFFTSTRLKVGEEYFKVGPAENDTKKSDLYIEPNGSANIYLGPVVVLQDRITFSSGALFCIMMDARPNTKSIGQIFGGGTGAIIDGFLPNGWRYQLSTSTFRNTAGNYTDEGVEPDIPQIVNPADTNREAVIERAILELQ